MKRRGATAGFVKGHLSLVLSACLQDFRRGPPVPGGSLGECPREALPARETAAGLVDGKVILRTGQMNRGDQAKEALVRLFDGRLAGVKLSSFGLGQATPVGIPLLDEITFHVNLSFDKK